MSDGIFNLWQLNVNVENNIHFGQWHFLNWSVNDNNILKFRTSEENLNCCLVLLVSSRKIQQIAATVSVAFTLNFSLQKFKIFNKSFDGILKHKIVKRKSVH